MWTEIMISVQSLADKRVDTKVKKNTKRKERGEAIVCIYICAKPSQPFTQKLSC